MEPTEKDESLNRDLSKATENRDENLTPTSSSRPGLSKEVLEGFRRAIKETSKNRHSISRKEVAAYETIQLQRESAERYISNPPSSSSLREEGLPTGRHFAVNLTEDEGIEERLLKAERRELASREAGGCGGDCPDLGLPTRKSYLGPLVYLTALLLSVLSLFASMFTGSGADLFIAFFISAFFIFNVLAYLTDYFGVLFYGWQGSILNFLKEELGLDIKGLSR